MFGSPREGCRFCISRPWMLRQRNGRGAWVKMPDSQSGRSAIEPDWNAVPNWPRLVLVRLLHPACAAEGTPHGGLVLEGLPREQGVFGLRVT